IVVRITALVDADAPAQITNGIAVWGPDTPTTDDPDDEGETPPIDVDRESKVSITKVADEARVTAGEETTFTVTVTNNGPSVMESGRIITLKERPGTGVSIRGYAIVSGAATLNGSGNDAALTTTAKLGVGESIVVRITALVDADAPARITNGIAIWGPDTPTTDDPDDEDETQPIPVDRESVLSIAKVADEARVKEGEATTFTVTVTNNGPSAIAVGKVIRLQELPSDGLQITGYRAMSNNATVAGTANAANVTTTAIIPVGGTIIISVEAVVTEGEDTPETITNGIRVWGP